MDERGHCLAAVLIAAAGELADLAAVADQLGGIGLDEIERWQSMDRLSQHLAGLAAFLTELSAGVPNVEPDLASSLAVLNTRALADRLAGRSLEVNGDSGEMEFFGA
jgi:hypothetical protein